MKFFVFVLLSFCVTYYANAEDEDGILCTAKTCSDYMSENPCSPIPTNCNIQNSTHSGIFLPSPDPCGCCQYCLVNLNEDDYCAKGEDGGLIPDTICGPGLYCFEGRCKKMSEMTEPITSCTKAQADYDQRRKDGTSGSMEIRPNCDDDGFYQPYKCVPGQTCFCVDKEGNRIFGEIPFRSNAQLELRCECSRKYYDVLKFFDRDSLYPNQHFRCQDNGDYDTIQCIGDDCMCTDALDGAPTFPSQASVNVSEISNDTLSTCFKEGVHLEGKYYYECSEKYIEVLNEIEEYKDQGYDTVFEIEFPTCDLNGKYLPVRKVTNVVDDQTQEVFHCVNPDGTRIGNYVGFADDTVEIDCKCARTTLLLSEDATEKPECCRNGNFNPVQCRRGKCYCVDSDGYQDVNIGDKEGVVETSVNEKNNLFCYDSSYQEICHSDVQL